MRSPLILTLCATAAQCLLALFHNVSACRTAAPHSVVDDNFLVEHAAPLNITVTSDTARQFTLVAPRATPPERLLVMLDTVILGQGVEATPLERARFAEELEAASAVELRANGVPILAAVLLPLIRTHGSYIHAFLLANETIEDAARRAIFVDLECHFGGRNKFLSVVDWSLRVAHNKLRYALGSRDGMPANHFHSTTVASTLVDVPGVLVPQHIVLMSGESVPEAVRGFMNRTGFALSAEAQAAAAARLTGALPDCTSKACSASQPTVLVTVVGCYRMPSRLGVTAPLRRAIVVSRYRENVAWLSLNASIAGDVWLYDKGGLDWPLPANVVGAFHRHVLLPNVGREAHSYLRFIIDNYDDLPDLAVFLQGRVDDHLSDDGLDALLRGVQVYEKIHAAEAGLREFSSWMGPGEYPPGNRLQPFVIDGEPASVGAWWRATFESILPLPAPPARVPIKFGALFCATRAQLRRFPRRTYELLLEQASVGASPAVAHFLESSWLYLMNYDWFQE